MRRALSRAACVRSDYGIELGQDSLAVGCIRLFTRCVAHRTQCYRDCKSMMPLSHPHATDIAEASGFATACYVSSTSEFDSWRGSTHCIRVNRWHTWTRPLLTPVVVACPGFNPETLSTGAGCWKPELLLGPSEESPDIVMLGVWGVLGDCSVSLGFMLCASMYFLRALFPGLGQRGRQKCWYPTPLALATVLSELQRA